ncbi:MAG: M23 family metallopeptidase [Caldilineaceae bacterium]
MARMFESDYIFGIHEPGGEQHMLTAGKTGWIVFTEGIGHDVNDRTGRDYRPYSDQGLGIITRLNNGYYPEGTIPDSRFYREFAQRCANFVANSPGCNIWIIGNEMNYRIERPQALLLAVPAAAAPAVPSANLPAPTTGANEGKGGGVLASIIALLQKLFASLRPQNGVKPASKARVADDAAIGAAILQIPPDDPFLQGLPERFSAINLPSPQKRSAEAAASATVSEEVITPDLYARCYTLCRNAIRALPGHENDQVLTGAVAPWNNQTTYFGNTRGDWVQYFQDILNQLGPDGLDGMTLHTYTHQADPSLITSSAKMGLPFTERHFEFRAYQDFLAAVPNTMRDLPVYITETDQDVPWLDQNINWVQRAYGEIDWWNQQPGNQKIRALVLYRWPPIDRWVIEGKAGVIEDFRMALTQDYRWRVTEPDDINMYAITTDIVNLRRTPGYRNKAGDDVLLAVQKGTKLAILTKATQSVDNLVWWQVRVDDAGQPALMGWVAQTAPNGTELLRFVETTTPPVVEGAFKVGDTVRTVTVVNMRRTAGYLNKPATDVMAGIAAATPMTIVAGPQQADNLVWWQVRIQSGANVGQQGWMAETGPSGDALLALVATTPPDEMPTGKFKAGDRVVTRNVVRLRRTPGYRDKPVTDVVADIALGVVGTVLGGPRAADALTWWEVETTTPTGATVSGWMADAGPDGGVLLDLAPNNGGTAPTTPTQLAVHDLVVAAANVRVRRTVGYLNKPSTDVLGDYLPQATLNLIAGPQQADSLPWWRVGGISSTGHEVVGWVAERAPNGAVLVALPPRLPGTQIPNKATGRYLGMPFSGAFPIVQLWGERPEVYSQITYDGVPLKGHNGIDFGTPIGTPILAVEDGVIAEVVYNDPSGFGHYVKVAHPWGEALYAHLESIAVQPGQSVKRGRVLGATGSTGFVTGPHLHFAIRINPFSRTDGWGGYSDPLPYFDPSAVLLPSYVLDSGAPRLAPPGTPSAQAAPPDPIAQKPGYAPDQPGVRRP